MTDNERNPMRWVPGGAGILASLDGATRVHSVRMAAYAGVVGPRLTLSESDVRSLRMGAELHDIGKSAIPATILQKHGALSAEERQIVRLHPEIGERICAGIQVLAPALPVIRHHHERYDGSGYPDGLAGEQIPLLARIVQVIDVFDALSSARPYKPALHPESALAMLEDDAERAWIDARIFAEFRTIIRAEIRQRGAAAFLVPALQTTLALIPSARESRIETRSLAI